MIAPMSDIPWAIDTNYRAIGSVGKLVQAFEAVEGARRKTRRRAETWTSPLTTHRWFRWSTES